MSPIKNDFFPHFIIDVENQNVNNLNFLSKLGKNLVKNDVVSIERTNEQHFF